MTSQLKVQDIFENDIDRKIEEVIKVGQDDEDVVANELQEYVVTSHIRENFVEVLEAFDEASRKPTEGVGIWISGFFGSGKSSFAKILGYILENREVKGTPASDWFLPKAGDDRIKAVLRGLNERVPTKSIIFDVRAKIDSAKGERLRDIMYRQLLTSFGYSPQFTLAQLELELEREGDLEQFESTFEEMFDKSWDERKGNFSFAKLEASKVLHELWPERFSNPDSWAHTVEEKGITPSELAERAVEIVDRRGDGEHLVFVIDEVGQYVSRIQDRLEDLRAIVEQLGKKGRGRLWMVATSQEKLNEVVEDIYDDKSQLPKVQDRFPIWVDLEPHDIREVTEQRILLKNAEGQEALTGLYNNNEGSLRAHTKVRVKGADSSLTERDFVKLYPLLPYQVDLAIDIVSGLRVQGGGNYQVGGSNRTIIKLAQQTVIHPDVNLGEEPLGVLVTLSNLYDLLVHNVTTETKLAIKKIAERFGEDSLETKLAKSVTLLECQRDVSRTRENLAAVLYPTVGAASLSSEVEQALEKLVEAELVREAQDGYKLVSPEEDEWLKTRRSISIRPSDHKRLIKRFFREQLEQVRPYSHQDVRSFRPQLVVDGEQVEKGDGDIRIEIHTTEDEGFEAKCEDVREESRKDSKVVHWVVPIDDQIHTALEKFERSERMIEKKERENLSREEQQLLAEEKERRNQLQQPSGLPRMFRSRALEGTLYMKEGIEYEARDLGDDLEAVIRGACGEVIPTIYTKFDLAAVPIRDSHVESLLEDSDLSGLPSLFYESDGLGLVRREGGTYKINPDAAPLREVHETIKRDAQSGKDLETEFTSPPYGWSAEAVHLFVATLLRAGLIEARFKNVTVKSHASPDAKEIFRTLPNFRSTSFRLREGVKAQDLTKVGKWYKNLFGQEIPDITHEDAVHDALAQQISPEREGFLELAHQLRSADLPGAEELDELNDALRSIIDQDPEDAIKTVASEADDLRKRIRSARELRREITGDVLQRINEAQKIRRDLWPRLQSILSEDHELHKAGERLEANLTSTGFEQRLDSIREDAQAVEQEFQDRYEDLHARRSEAYRQAAEDIEVTSDFDKLGPEDQEKVLAPIKECICENPDLDGAVCTSCRTEISALETHLEVLDSRRTQATHQIQELLGSEASTSHIRIREVAPDAISTPEEAEEATEDLKKLILDELENAERVVLE